MPRGYQDWHKPVDLALQTVPTVAVDIASQTLARVAVDIAAQTLAALGIDIKAQTIEALTANIKTAAGVNIMIDKLSQPAYHSRTDTLFPAGQTGDPVLFRDLGRFGIFYRRGCRGHIEEISIYLKNTDTVEHDVDFALKENPDGGIVIDNIRVSQAPGTTGWVIVPVRRYWSYDSLFIYNKDPYSAALQIGYWDTGEEDGFFMYDEERWYVDFQRSAYRVRISALSIGDLPISGTVNSILVPSSSLESRSGSVTIPAYSSAILLDFYGQGRSCFIGLWTDYARMEFDISLDGQYIRFIPHQPLSPYNIAAYFGDLGQGIGIQLTRYDTTLNQFGIMITAPFEFRYRLQIGAMNTDTVDHNAAAAINYIKTA